MKRLTLFLFMFACFAGLNAQNKSGIHYEYMQDTIAPGTDFYRYATGNWLKYHPQPKEYPSWEAFGVVYEETNKQLMTLIDSLTTHKIVDGSVGQKIADLYKLAMDSVRRNQEGAAPLKRMLDRIEGLQTKQALEQMTAEEHDDLFFGIGLSADEKNSDWNIMCIGQGGLSLGVRDYYLENDPATKRIREAFKQHVVNLHKLCGFSEKEATRRMQLIMKYETLLAKKEYSMEQLRDPEKNYHKMSVADLSKYTGLDFDQYFKARTYDQTDSVDLGQPEPVKYGCQLYNKAKLNDLKVLYEWAYIRGGSNYLSDDFRAENFHFSQVRTGAQQDRPRWKRALGLVDNSLGEALGQMYVEKYFPASSKQRMLNLVYGLQDALSNRIQQQDWMSDLTKQAAQEKLKTITIKIGYPDKWEDISDLKINPEISLWDNMQAIARFYWELDKKKNYNKPVDKAEWGMTPQTINAYYNPTTNEICFPAGILQPPFFDAQADDATNYGAIGVVIGHEMTHGFDDQGAQYDQQGNMRMWWQKEDFDKFKGATEQLAAHFDTLWVIPGELKSNGHQCLGENIADHGGLMVAYEALENDLKQHPLPMENGFTPEQRFFLSFAGVWAGVSTPEILRYYAKMDVHSAKHLRVNGSLPMIDAWYEAFGIEPTMPMYVAPEKRVKIW